MAEMTGARTNNVVLSALYKSLKSAREFDGVPSNLSRRWGREGQQIFIRSHRGPVQLIGGSASNVQ